MPLLDLTTVVPGPIGTVANHLLAAPWVNRTYADIKHHCRTDPTTNFFSICLHHIGIGYTTNADALLRIPETGPVLVVANHPFGGADAIILADILNRVRPAGARLLANSLLERIPEARPHIIRDHGPGGLYTASLFNFKPGFLPRLGPAIELGRSFVTSKYQRKLTSLFMLWKGVCRFAAANP